MSSKRPYSFHSLFHRNRVAPATSSKSNSSVEVVLEAPDTSINTEESEKLEGHKSDQRIPSINNIQSRHFTFLCVHRPKVVRLSHTRPNPPKKKSDRPKLFSTKNLEELVTNADVNRDVKSSKKRADLETFTEDSVDLNRLISSDDEGLFSVSEPNLCQSISEINIPLDNPDFLSLLDPINPHNEFPQDPCNYGLQAQVFEPVEGSVGDVFPASGMYERSCFQSNQNNAPVFEHSPEAAEGETSHANRKGLRFMKRIRVALRSSLTMFRTTITREEDISLSTATIPVSVSERVRRTFATKYMVVRSMFRRKQIPDRTVFNDDEFWVNN